MATSPTEQQLGLQARRNAASVIAVEASIVAIEAKTDNITVTGAVDLDDMQPASAMPVGLSGYEARIAALEAIVIDFETRIAALETP